MSRILITGAAGFVGYHTARSLCRAGWHVTGVDNLNDYYDVGLKQARLDQLKSHDNFTFRHTELADKVAVADLFEAYKPAYVIHLAAQAGVRYSLENPHAYSESNVTGFLNILEGCRHHDVHHLIFASSSSVYGANTKMPFSEHDGADHPVSLYGATKKANEVMAHAYADLYQIPCTGLRFFTVYGPWGRPDMAYFKFTDAIYKGRAIDVYNYGDMQRDFTYIDDVVKAIEALIDHIPQAESSWTGKAPDPASARSPYRLYNIGNHTPEKLTEMIAILEELTGRNVEKNYVRIQPGDVPATYADVEDLQMAVGFQPATSMRDGLAAFVDWYKWYYGI
jgi:UDP-glucuronate 4-epimerase